MGGSLGEHRSDLSDTDLLELVQRQTFRYFWDLAHPTSGLIKDRASGPPDLVTIGGSGYCPVDRCAGQRS